ncbi:hypothetical protein [Hymenobacter sp. 5516J-16]|nr:hypothetical protein [Hymenobacter sp. 5516J-16]
MLAPFKSTTAALPAWRAEPAATLRPRAGTRPDVTWLLYGLLLLG